MFLTQSALCETYTVVTSDDEVIFSSCDLEFVCPTFRAAIVATNSTEEADTINFDIPDGDVHTITLVDTLPPITSQLHIDGYSQPGATKNTNSTLTGLNTQLKIELDGTMLQLGFDTYAGLWIKSDDCIISGLVIKNFSSRAIFLFESDNHIISGNFIGVEADGVTAASNGVGILMLDSAGNAVGLASLVETRNLISGNKFNGITISGAKSELNSISSNLIGTDITGKKALGNGERGILITAPVGEKSYAAFNIIGGADESYRNIISGNTDSGVKIFRGESNTVSANYIGLTVSGDEALKNGAGVFIEEGSKNKIGGSGQSEGNVISGNLYAGIKISAGWIADDPEEGGELQRNATGNLIYGNYIGTDQSGLEAIPNGQEATPNGQGGIFISSSSANEGAFKADENVIGNVAVEGSGNLISGNNGPGIQLDGKNTLKTLIQRNRIGLSGNDTTPLGNETHGVLIRAGSSENVIGSKFEPDEEDAKNIIAFNGGGRFSLAFPFVEYNSKGPELFGHGVFVEKGTKNTIRLNSIYLNEGRGIDLGEDHTFTVNDPAVENAEGDYVFDSDTGANDLHNFPVVVAIQFSDQKMITWELNHKVPTVDNPSLAIKIDFYTNNEPDPSGFGEGRQYYYTHWFGPDPSKGGRLQTITGLWPDENYISATATDSDGNTSEFSMVDTDGDAIADAWETPDMGMDVNEDGKIDLNLSDYGASPTHKDIFVEIDGMDDRIPGFIAKARVFAAFALAPVDNPDGVSGIALKLLDGGDTTIPREVWRNADDSLDWPAALDQVKNGSAGGDFSAGKFGSPTDRTNTNWPFIRAAKRLVFHYAFMADIFEGTRNEMPDAEAGAADLGRGMGGNDMYLALGEWNPPGGSELDRATVLMHELGHNLGLGHGGRDSFGADQTNYKPNYHSIMNYTWEVASDWMNEVDKNNNGEFDGDEVDHNNNDTFDSMYRLDFSRVAYGPYGSPPNEKIFLDETNLDETEITGIGGQVDTWTIIGPKSTPINVVLEQGKVDWNSDGDTDDTVMDQLGINNPNPDDSDIPVANLFAAREDWKLLRYYFLESADMRRNTHTPPPDPELNYDDVLKLNSLGILSGILRFKYHTFNATESTGSAIITVTRGGGTVGTVTVDYTTVDGSAISNADYTPVSGTLTFLEGEYLQTFAVPIIQDGLEEGTESLQLQLSNPTGGGLIFSGEETSQLQIEDDDGPGTFQFATSYLDVPETEGVVAIEVSRTMGDAGAATVDYATIDHTATGGQDYIPCVRHFEFCTGPGHCEY